MSDVNYDDDPSDYQTPEVQHILEAPPGSDEERRRAVAHLSRPRRKHDCDGYSEFDLLPDRLRGDKEVASAAVRRHWISLEHATENIRNDSALVLEAVKQCGEALEFASDDLKKQKAFILAAIAAIKEHGGAFELAGALKHVSDELQSDEDVVRAAVTIDGRALQYASVELQNNARIVLAAMQNNPQALHYASENIRNDKAFLLNATQNSSVALGATSEDIRRDKEVVLAIVKKQGRQLHYACEKLKNDIQVALASVENLQEMCGWGCVSSEILSNKQYTLAAVRKNGHVLPAVADEFLNDKEVVLAAFEHGCVHFNCVSNDLKRDPKVVVAAIEHDSSDCVDSWMHASKSKELMSHREVALAVVKKYSKALGNASTKVRNDKEVILAAVAKNGDSLKYASDRLRGDLDVIRVACYDHPPAVEHIDYLWFGKALSSNNDVIGFPLAECISFVGRRAGLQDFSSFLKENTWLFENKKQTRSPNMDCIGQSLKMATVESSGE